MPCDFSTSYCILTRTATSITLTDHAFRSASECISDVEQMFGKGVPSCHAQLSKERK